MADNISFPCSAFPSTTCCWPSNGRVTFTWRKRERPFHRRAMRQGIWTGTGKSRNHITSRLQIKIPPRIPVPLQTTRGFLNYEMPISTYFAVSFEKYFDSQQKRYTYIDLSQTANGFISSHLCAFSEMNTCVCSQRGALEWAINSDILFNHI